MKHINHVPNFFVIIIITLISVVLGVSSCKGLSNKKIEREQEAESEAGFKAYKELVAYLEDKAIIKKLYEKEVTDYTMYSSFRVRVPGEATMTHDTEERTLSYDAKIYNASLGRDESEHSSGKLDRFTFLTTEQSGVYPIIIHARWTNSSWGTDRRTLEITCERDIYGDKDCYVKFMLHSDKSNVIIHHKVKSSKDFRKIVSKAIQELPKNRCAELSRYSDYTFPNESAADDNINNDNLQKDNFNVSIDNENYEDGTPSNSLYSVITSRLLTESDIRGLSKAEIRLIRNEVFARHGYIFKNQELKDYFSSKSWYNPISSDVASQLSELEMKNVEFLKKHE